MIKLTKN